MALVFRRTFIIHRKFPLHIRFFIVENGSLLFSERIFLFFILEPKGSLGNQKWKSAGPGVYDTLLKVNVLYWHCHV